MQQKDAFEKLDDLKNILREMEHVLVAFSGGVDSAFLLKIARLVLPDKVTALTAVSPTLPQHEKEETVKLASQMKVPHILVRSREMDNPDYVKNPVDRCYFCKSELYRLCLLNAAERGIKFVVDGFTSDDENDYRPGFVAKKENAIRSPLLEAGLTKEEIRMLSKDLNLPTWNKPASPCLASRIPYGIPVSLSALAKIENLEIFLKTKGLLNFRVRYHEKIVRLEVSSDDFKKFFNGKLRDECIEQCKKEGFEFVTLDLECFRSGRLNEAVKRGVEV